MAYLSFEYCMLIIIALCIYYLIPVKQRWMVLLCASAIFYAFFLKTGWIILVLTICVSFLAGLIISRANGNSRKTCFVAGVILTLMPWLLLKNSIFFEGLALGARNITVPIGISFFTLQMISYLADVYQGKIDVERNLAKYALFISYFPQIIQGPIPRYSQLSKELFKQEYVFKEKEFSKGIYLIIWGFFLKLVIADKSGVIVDNVFANYHAYSGTYLWIGSFLYSIQLYTDFFACSVLAIGVSKLFGIEVIENFQRPYFATSIKDFWRRWHISLSAWLKDYVYIPLGGSRTNIWRRCLNILITFAVSGIWHGSGIKYLVWGVLHAIYQIIGIWKAEIKSKVRLHIKIRQSYKCAIDRVGTFLLVNWAWVLFRAESTKEGLEIILHMFTDINPWILFNDRLFTLGLEWKDCIALLIAIGVLIFIEIKQESGIQFCDVINRQALPIRWGICITAIVVILVFGTYGWGYEAQNFIYGEF